MALDEEGTTGRRYLERGRPVTLLARWGPGEGPHTVLIQREDGSTVVRPFRGLRRFPDGEARPRPRRTAP